MSEEIASQVFTGDAPMTDAVTSEPRRVGIPDFCLVVLMGATGAGKSSFAARHFLPTEVIGSDWARGRVASPAASRAGPTTAA